MLGRDSGFYLHVPSTSAERLLHPGRVLRLHEGVYTAEMADLDVHVRPGQAVFVLFEAGTRFLQQPARIDAVLQSQPLTIGFETTGDPISAEARQSYRVSTVTAGLTAMIGTEDCPLRDISATGFAVVSTAAYLPGQTVDVVLEHEGRSYSGTARFQSIRRLPDGRIRYGLHGAADGGNLEKGLREIAMAIQRKQLQRRARD